MTTTLQAPDAGTDLAPMRRAVSTKDASPHADGRTPGWRAAGFLHLQRGDLAVLLPVLAVGMALNIIGLFRYPRFSEAEGTLTGWLYAADRWGALDGGGDRLAALGWVQMLGWTRLTRSFEQLALGRELMMVALAVSAVLLWALVRRLGLPRGVAAAALLILLASPLAVQVHRGAAPENLASVWILAAFVLATTRSRQLVGFVLAVLAAVAAALTSPMFVLLVPFVAWMIVRNSRLATRRYTLTTAATVLVLAAAAYPMVALLDGELLPTADRASLVGALGSYLGSWQSTGVLTDPVGPSGLVTWFELSPVLLVLSPLAMLIGLGSRSLRPFAAALLLLTALLAVGPDGEIAMSRAVVLLPLAAVVVPGVAWHGWGRLRDRLSKRAARVAVAVVALTTVVALAVPHAIAPWRAQLTADANASSVSALAWIEEEVPRGERIVVDDSLRVGLYEAGLGRDDVVGYTDLDGAASVPDVAWLVVTDTVSAAAARLPALSEAIEGSTVVASFGQRQELIEIRQVRPEQPAAEDPGDESTGDEDPSDEEPGDEQVDEDEAAAREAFGSLLVQNPNLVLEQGADALEDGMLDPRAQLLLADLTARGEVTVADLPEIAGEEGRLRRTVVLTAVDGEALDFAAQRDLLDRLEQLPPGWAPSESRQQLGSLTLVWPLSPPPGLLPSADS